LTGRIQAVNFFIRFTVYLFIHADKMLRITLFLFLILNHLAAFAQKKYAYADSIALSVKSNNCENLHAVLIKNLETDEERVRAFYTWITANIQYDVVEWKRPEKATEKQEPAEVLQTKKAICHGYATLFRELCHRSGIPCYLVSGYNRIDNKFDDAGHTWNIVYMNNRWQPVDATWGAGGVDSRGRFVREFTEKYFLTDPVVFLSDHFPFDPMWQLVKYPVKLIDYRMSKWIYEDKTTPLFNFNDTIAAWEQLDSLEKEYTSAIRMLRFSPGETKIRQQLSYALFMKGNAAFDKGNKIMAVLYPRKPVDSKKPSRPPSKILKAAQLDSIDNFYRNADFYYKQVQFINANEKSVLKNNLDALRFNRDVIRKEKLNMSK